MKCRGGTERHGAERDTEVGKRKWRIRRGRRERVKKEER
jgi:hypothetical protein